MFERKPILILLVFILFLYATTRSVFALTCGRDFNNDGDIVTADGETGTCIQTDAGDPFCLLSSAECVVVQKDATCPSGTTLNSISHRCESDPACSIGSYDNNSKTCLLITDAICPEGSLLNESSDKCGVYPVCNTGIYDNSSNMCVETSERTCPDGTIENAVTGKCEAVPVCLQGTYNKSYNACVFTTTTDPACPVDSVINTATDQCEAPPMCSPGVFDGFADLCIDSVTSAPATCPQGTTNNLKRDICEGNGTCIPLTTFDSISRSCASNPGCGEGLGSYKASLNMCYTSSSAELLNTAATKFAQMGTYLCDQNTNREGNVDTCTPQVKHDETVSRVMSILSSLGISVICPEQTTIDQRSLQCAQHPYCPTGSTLDLARDLCIATPSCSQGLYNINLNQCEIVYNDTFTPICPSGTYLLESISDFCLSYPQCVSGTTFNSSSNKCETSIGCPSGIYDTVNNVCSLSAGVSCPEGTVFNADTRKCEAGYTCPSGSSYSASSGFCEYPLQMGYCPTAPAPSFGNNSSVIFNYSLNKCIYSNIYVQRASFNTCKTTNCAGSFARASCTIKSLGVDFLRSELCISDPICADGSTLDPSLPLICRFPGVNPSCPVGTVFNAGKLLCEAPYSCPAGASYDSSIEMCSTIVNPTCISGTLIDTVSDLCRADPSCLPGFSFNFGTHRCEAVPNCPAGSAYDSILNRCVQYNGNAGANCPENTVLNTATDWCEGTLNCSAGAIYNKVTKQCEATPQCTAGTLNYTIFSWAVDAPGYQYPYCDIPATVSHPSCVAGTTLNQDIDKCVAAVSCPSGSYFNQTTQWCETNPSCHANAYYYPSLGICVVTVNAQPGCPSGLTFNAAADICRQSPRCSDGSYDAAADICNINKITNPKCPAGTTIDGALGKCVGNAICLNGSMFDTALNICIKKTFPACVSGTSLNRTNDLCESSPACAQNTGTYDSIANRCILSTAPICPSTLTLDRTIDKCSTFPSCSFGNFDPATNRCRNTGGTPTSAQCPTGTYLDPEKNKCTAVPQCETGAYNNYLDQCSASIYCSSGTYNNNTDVCDISLGSSRPASCPAGMVLEPATDVCVSNATCPAVSLLDTGTNLCFADPSCASATVFDPSIDMCVPFLKTCPYDTATETYSCPLVSGIQTCSPDPCFDPNEPLPPPPTNNLTNDGPTDPNTGQCLGQIRIFSGTSQRCLLPGQRAVTADCCSMPIPEDIYNETSNPYTRFQQTVVDPLNLLNNDQLRILTDYLGAFQGGCDMNELMLNVAMKDKRTHFIGQYCLVKWLAWCAQKAQMHCIFNSTLSRIIHEQGRPQLKRFGPDGGWGTPEQPNCEGFMVDEFQMLDFSRIDLSEFIALIQDRVIANLSNAVADKSNTFYEETLPNFTSGATTTN